MKDGGMNEFKGWSDDGLERFNELCHEVTEDRTKNGKKFDDTYKATMRGVTRKRKRASVSTIQVFDEFSGDERTRSDEDDDSESEGERHGRQHEAV